MKAAKIIFFSLPRFSTASLTLLGVLALCPLAHSQGNTGGATTGGATPGGAPTGGGMGPAPTSLSGPGGIQQNTPNTQQTGPMTGTTLRNNQRYPGDQDRSLEDTRISDSNRVATVAAEAPTEFQVMVTGSTGRNLPIFGSDLFQNAPSTFAPVDQIPVTPDYIIGPGDELRIQVWGQVNQQGALTVDRSGNIPFPEVGSVHVAGIPFSQVTSYLKQQLGRVYRNFDINVNMGQLRSIPVFVFGQARRPGAYTVGSLSTLLNALFASGGPLPQGSLRDIQLKRGSETIVHFDLYDVLLRGDKTHDVRLEAGDVIFIPTVGQQVAISGSVLNPAIYELRTEKTVADVIALAGGLSNVATGAQARLERIFEHRERSILDLNLTTGSNTLVQAGDIISITSITDRFSDAVTLRGNVANPGRYVWHQGMRIHDLIPNQDALITRNYWRKRNQLGQIVIESSTEGSLTVRPPVTPDSRGASIATPGGTGIGPALVASSSVFAAKTDVVLSAPDINWNYAVIERLNTTTLTTSLIPFNLGAVVLNNDAAQNLDLQPGDVITIFSMSDITVPTAQQTRFVRLEGEFPAAGIYSVLPGETLRQLVVRAGGLTPDAYLYASEFTRESTRRVEQQRLNEYVDSLEAKVAINNQSIQSKAINDRDVIAAQAGATEARSVVDRLRAARPSGRIVLEMRPESIGAAALPDISLEDGDRFIVPRLPANVNVEGQVYKSSAFLFVNGRRVKDYLKLSGGPDRQADARREFLVRADGSVISRQYGNFERIRMLPGDTIVVPPQLERRALIKDLLDISSIIGQFGLGAAAVNVLK